MIKNIVLIGFMGCGKSSVGRRLAAETGFRFLDSDECVVEHAGMPISEVFALHGEAYFRDLEAEALRGLGEAVGIVLATGGGAILREDNRTFLKEFGTICWLDANPDILFERASRLGRRPLLQTPNPRESFDALLSDRRDIYEQASDFRIDSSLLSHDGAAAAILEALRERESTNLTEMSIDSP